MQRLQPTRTKPVILVSLLLAAFAINLDTTIVNVALPTLVRQLHASNSQLQWVVDAYNLVFAALLLASGSLSDRVGRKGMLLAGLAVVGAASLAGSFATSASGLIAARCVMGLGAAAVFPATLSLISNVFVARKERALAIGLWGATAGMAIALGPIVGGWLLERFSWSSVFFVMAPVAAVAIALVASTVPTSRDPQKRRIDLAGFALSSAAMALLIFTIIEAPNHGWASTRTLASFAITLLLGVAFARWEQRAQAPMLDISLFRDLRFTAASSAVTISFFTLLGFIFLVTQYFQFFKGYSPLTAGVHLLPVAASVGVASVLGTKLAVRYGTKLVVTTGLVAMAAFYGWASTTTVATTLHADRAADDHLRRRDGTHQRPSDRSDHGRRAQGQGRRRLGSQRRYPPTRRDTRRRDHRQRLRLPLQQPTQRRPPSRPAGVARTHGAPIGRRGAHRGEHAPAQLATPGWRRPCTTRQRTPSSTASASAAWSQAPSQQPGQSSQASFCHPTHGQSWRTSQTR